MTTVLSDGSPPLSQLRVPAFDGLRGIAVLAVIFYHLSDYCPAQNPLKTFLRAGWCGVDLFFVLSGFLITGILIDTRSVPNYFQAFYARRLLRIFPVYYAALISVLVLAHVFPELDSVLPVAHDRIFYFFYLNNWWILLKDSWHPNIIGHFWSLAIEEQFYLVWPLVVWLLPLKRMNWAAVIGIALAPVIRLAIYAHYGNVRDIVENPFCRMDSLLVGALLASVVRKGIHLGGWPLYTSASLAAAIIAGAYVAFVPLQVLHASPFIASGLAIVFGGLVLTAFLERNSRATLQKYLCNPALRFCGRYSYGMYVYHVPLLWLIAKLLTGRKTAVGLPRFLLLSAMEMAVTMAVAKLSFDCFESRFLRMKVKFVAAKTR